MSAASTLPGEPAPEFSRRVDIRQADGRTMTVEANDDERRALARRFAIVSIERLTAELTPLKVGNSVSVEGSLDAAIVQSCAVSGEDLPVTITEPVSFRFVTADASLQPNQEIELDADDLDEVTFDGASFDLGEAVAQSLALAIDPFATGPQAEEARRNAGLLDPDHSGPFAALASLKKS